MVIDEDLGISADGLSERSGFQRLTAEVALGHAGLVLGLEVSRVARNNSDWYRLLDLCGVTDTVIGDLDGLYHPGSFNDRLLLGMKGTISEAESYTIRQRLDGGIRNKAARGELRKALPVGLVWGEADGEIRLDPDEAVQGAIRTILDRFAELGSAHRVWVWLREQRDRVSAQAVYQLRDPVGHPQLRPGAQGAHQPRLRGRVRVRQDALRALHRRSGSPAQADPQGGPGRLGGADLGSPPRLHRQRHVPSKPSADSGQPPLARGGAGRRGPRGLCVASGDRCLRPLLAQARRALRGPARSPEPGVFLPWHRPGMVHARRRHAGSTRRSPARCCKRSRQPGSRPRSRPPTCSSKTTTRRWRSGGCRSSAPAMRPSGPSGAIARSSPSTGWSRAALSVTGRRRSVRSPKPRPSSACANGDDPARSPTQSASSSWRSARTSAGCGQRQPRPIATASSCCGA